VASPTERLEVEFLKGGVILTLIIHWLGPPLFLPWSSTAMVAVYSGRSAKGPYQESDPASDGGFMVFLLNSLYANGGFHYFAVRVRLMIRMNSIRTKEVEIGHIKEQELGNSLYPRTPLSDYRPITVTPGDEKPITMTHAH